MSRKSALAVLALPFALLACAPANSAPSGPASPSEAASPAKTATTDEELNAEFRAAVVDASVAEPDEVSDQLTALVPKDPDLKWNKKGDRVLMVTWTSWDGYDDQVGKEVVLQREAWVTAAPELKMPRESAFKSHADYDAHRDWFNLQRSLSYDEKNGYPWTRLGYTYDWGNPDSEVGLSEFVTWAKTPVTIKQVATTEDYCSS